MHQCISIVTAKPKGVEAVIKAVTRGLRSGRFRILLL